METTTLDAARTISDLAAKHPVALKVFQRHGLDFCCGGARPLAQACAAQGLDPALVLDEIRAEEAREQGGGERWEERSTDELIDHILEAFHEPLREDLVRLEAMARKVHRVHGAKDQAMFDALLETYMGLKAELDSHLMKEEQILFPRIRQGLGNMCGPPIKVMHMEHDDADAALRRLRELTNDYRVPPAACATWRGLWEGLERFDRELREHIRLENDILFPRALG